MLFNGASRGYFNQPSAEPSFFSLQDLRDEVEQNAPLLQLKEKLLDKIMEFVPLKDRLLRVRPVCRKLSESVQRSIKSVEFLRDELDYCDDAKIAFFLAVYGKNVEHMNYDLFRSCSLREYTQWSWRQSVISSVTRCAQLRQLDILICCRHRLRDGDLQVIFKHCVNLEVLRIDASFVNGNCFVKAPTAMRKVELECCQAFSKQNFLMMCTRLINLDTLHFSLLTCLDEQVIKRIGDMKNLRNLSMIADAEQTMNQFRLAEIRRLPKLSTLCLDGVSNVTDKFLGDLSDTTASLAGKSLEHLSLACCKNIGPSGIGKLKSLPKLKSLSLDGVCKRDVSTGLEAVASAGMLERLLIADDAAVNPMTVLEVVRRCGGLRTLDISNNGQLMDERFAAELYNARANSSDGLPMKILTDYMPMWIHVPQYQMGQHVEIIYIGPLTNEYVESVSPMTVQQLPRGYLVPDLRRGNRYKMLDSNTRMSMSPEQFDPSISPDIEHNQENMPPIQLLETPGSLDKMLDTQDEQIARILYEIQQTAQQNIELYGFNPNPLLENMLQPTMPVLQQAISCADFENSITIGSAGAPGPPKDKNAELILKHSRPSRPKRQAQKEKAIQRRSGTFPQVATKPTGPSFTEDDFPPLG